MTFFSFLIGVLCLVAGWFVFKKMGREGWEGIVPFYNLYVLFEELYGNGWRFLLLLIPIVDIIIAVKLFIDLAHAFNKPTAFCLGLIFLYPIFMSILAFSDAVYGDGSKANTKSDFVSRATAVVKEATNDIVKEVKEAANKAEEKAEAKEEVKEEAKEN